MNDTKNHEVKWVSYVIIASFIVLSVWGWYFLEQFTNWRITHFLGTAQEEPIPMLIPLAVSVLGPLIAVIFWKRAVGIASNGVSVTAKVHSIGGEFQNMRNVEFEYGYDGREYTKKMSLSSVKTDNLNPGGPLEIIVDKRKPTRILVK